MTLDEILEKHYSETFEGNLVSRGEVAMARDRAKQAIREAIERAEPEFRPLADRTEDALYNSGYNHALSNYRIALLRELGISD